ncbi:retron St85 family RNA-directed DNA polymerase [Maribacter sp. 2-571]|uniref:retron St85 family RNA-directed DNA polymerase n=1 Tax=Maribacter sp. 2-571 TaxID=3417569 RepID=UPI003D32789F
MTYLLDNYKKRAKELGKSDAFIKETSKYINTLTAQQLPVIFSLPHLCLSSTVSIRHTVQVCESNRRDFYKRFKIKKKRGGYRVIQTPTNELKYLQKWILVNILEKVPSHSASKGFEKNLSIKDNAECHLNANCILKIDLLRFFDSINERRIYGIFKSLGYRENLCVYFAKICTIEQDEAFFKAFKKNEQTLKEYLIEKNEGILPQGAPSSPKLSNLILRRLDYRLSRLCEKRKINYSRYADDLTFSGNEEDLKKIKKIAYKIIQSENLFVNFGKTRFLKRGSPFYVTGLSIHNDKVKVIGRKKKEIEHHLYHCHKNGVVGHLTRAGITNKNFKDWLFGSICFVYSIEPEIGQTFFDKFNKINWPL